VASRGIVYVVFLLPIIASIIFGSLVLIEVLKQPDRELKMWQFKSSDSHIVSDALITILGIQNHYSTTSPIEIQAIIDDRNFDCGDLYITIFDLTHSSKQVVSQNAFFDQCFDRNNSILPVDDKFSEIIDTPGNYEIVLEMIDKSQKKTISSNAKFMVE